MIAVVDAGREANRENPAFEERAGVAAGIEELALRPIVIAIERQVEETAVDLCEETVGAGAEGAWPDHVDLVRTGGPARRLVRRSRGAVGADHVDVDLGDDPVERYRRVGDEMPRAPEAALFPAVPDEEDRAFRPRAGGERLRNRQRAGAAGRVVVGRVVDVVTVHRPRADRAVEV